MSGMTGADGYRETAHCFACEREQLLGVVAHPAAPAAHDLGVLIVVGGPQYRAGSHRHFVQLARSTAAAGYPVMRFDCRGMGDSTGQAPGFEHHDADIAAAITAFQAAAPSVKRVVLWGLCDGASASLLYLDERGPDPRVAGLCLLNPWVRSEATLAQVHVRHYYLQRLRQRAFWAKLLKGGVALEALRGFLDNLRKARSAAAAVTSTATQPLPYTQRMARAWAGFGGSIQLVLSGNDLTAREFRQVTACDPAWQRALRRRDPACLELADADHTFSQPPSSRATLDGLVGWLTAQHTETANAG
jgi:exosortase A-associated hydrolase 1